MVNRLSSPRSAAAVLALALALPLAGHAAPASSNADQPINIEADRLQYDNANRVSRFFGNVVATQGTATIRAEQMEVRQDNAGNQFGVATGTASKRAFFSQLREGTDERVEGEGQRIEYDSRGNTVKLVGNAILRRYHGSTLWDQSTGGTITYNNATSTFNVDGGPNSASPTGRVRAMITPEPKAPAKNGATGGTAK